MKFKKKEICVSNRSVCGHDRMTAEVCTLKVPWRLESLWLL